MSRPQQVVFFPTKQEAADFEAKLYAQALANGQVCDRWAEIIVAPEGFGVPVKDRVLVAASAGELAKVVEWTAPVTDNLLSFNL